ncbi:MAG: glycosyltransferase [Planctomycetes bacterium]|jgi:glycosyltransferase involved in cell wall biosynthesis|nr:glycosyltransferase [Planctomycetota bacterium]
MSTTPSTPLVVAYVVNRYPAPSHSFIRREILALEQLGVVVQRFSVRPGQVTPGNDADADEQRRTQVLLAGGALPLLWSLLAVAVRRPLRLLRTMALTFRLGRRSDRGLLRQLIYLLEACRLLRALDSRARFVHAHFGTNSTDVALLCTALGGPPFTFTAHGPEEFERPGGINLRDKITQATAVVAISDFGRSQLCRYTPIDQWRKVQVVRCGVDERFLLPPPLPVPAPPSLLWIGRMVEEKGIPVLLAACSLLQARGLEWHMTLVGGGPLEPWVRGRVTEHGLDQRIEFAGWRNAEQIRDHLDRTRGLVVPSFAEGLPVVLMEALARGRPAIATRIAGIPELVEPGQNGWLVTAGSADQLADAMQELLTMATPQVERLGAAGRARVARSHDVRREAAVLCELWQNAIR